MLLSKALLLLAAALPGDPPRVELVTIGPGDGLETAWGGSALHLYDREDRFDLAYEFEGPIARRPFPDLLVEYSRANRTITRRPLDLSPESAERLASRLSTASVERSAVRPSSGIAIPHFGDSSSRIAAELDRATGGALRRADQPLPGTLRAYLLRPLRAHALSYVALDLMLAGGVDRPVGAFEAAFLPEALAALVDRASAAGGRKLVEREYDAYRSTRPDGGDPWTWPWTKVYMFFVAPFVALAFWRRKIATKIYGAISELGGIGLALLWFDGKLPWFAGNWNILTLSPLLFASFLDRGGKFARRYLIFRLVVLIILSVGAGLGLIHQAIGAPIGALLPMTVALFAAERRAARGATGQHV